MSDDDKVKKLPVKFKAPPAPDMPMLKVVQWDGKCNHSFHVDGGKVRDAHYLIREGETEVECGLCGTRLDPMFVLRRLANEETRWERTRQQYKEEMQRLAERERTKCHHCGKMTRISRR